MISRVRNILKHLTDKWFTRLYDSELKGGEMLRGVITEKDLARTRAGGQAQKPDDYVDQLWKFIPSEIVSFYVAIFGAATAATGITSGTYWIMFVMGTLVVTL